MLNSVNFSKNKINTNLVHYQEQNEQEHLQLQQFCPTKNTLKIKSLNLQTWLNRQPVQTVMHNSVYMAKVTWNFTSQSTPPESTKLKCSEISTLQNRQIKLQLKYSVLQYIGKVARTATTLASPSSNASSQFMSRGANLRSKVSGQISGNIM